MYHYTCQVDFIILVRRIDYEIYNENNLLYFINTDLVGAIPLYIFGLFLYLVLELMETENLKMPNLFKLIEKLLEEFEK